MTEPNTPETNTDQAEAPEQQVGETPREDQQAEDVQETAAEARKYRKRLQEAKTALEAANARVDTLQTAEVERIAETLGIMKPAAVWLAGLTLEGLRDQDGNIDAEQARQEIQEAQQALGLARKAANRPDPAQVAPSAGEDPDNWASGFKI